MGKVTGIAWTDHTFNPWWGCAEVSPGCAHCYARTFAKRVGFGNTWDKWAREFRTFDDKHWVEPRAWDRAAKEAGKPALVFCGSMCDILDHRAPSAPRMQTFKLAENTPNLIWLFLTKRTENLTQFFPASWYQNWPANVRIGYTAENNDYLKRRADDVRRLKEKIQGTQPVIFISGEPLLGPLTDLPQVLAANLGDWVICGGESGPGARPCNVEWLRAIVEHCKAAWVPCFLKQFGAHPIFGQEGWKDIPAHNGQKGATWDNEAQGWDFPITDRKGGDPAEWPEDLRVQQFPQVTA